MASMALGKDTVRVILTAPRGWLRRVDEWRHREMIATRAEAIRRLVDASLRQEEEGPSGRKPEAEGRRK